MSTTNAFAPDNRTTHRHPTELKTIVRVRETNDDAWKEVTVVRTVSRNGAGFSLKRPCTVGRLVMLVMPLDPALRAYDVNEENYPVMGLVQYCNEGMINGEPVFHVGVGFVGRTIPDSYKSDPTQNYHICGMNEDGLWKIAESKTKFRSRKYPRFSVAFDVSISLIQKSKKTDNKETTITRNISATGASVVCSLEAEVGDRVKFASKEHDFYSIAIVRNRDEVNDLPPTLHLEFVDTQFPMEKVYNVIADNAENDKIEEVPVSAPRVASASIGASGAVEFTQF